MTDNDVTHVTRNTELCPDCFTGYCSVHGVHAGVKRSPGSKTVRVIPPEIKLVIDMLASAALLYYATHPDCLDGVGDKLRLYRNKFTHRVSVWATQQSIRSLPETDA